MPAARNAYRILAPALRLSIAGRWNTMARRIGGTSSRPPHVMRPREGVVRPIAIRSNVVFPEPFGPIKTVGAPRFSVRVIRSRIVTAPAATVTLSNAIGRSVAGARMFIPPTARPHAVRSKRVR